ncbi:MAG TPA: NUDIX hydrolase [Dissulfurispiraceae bacterium]|nr:NUDIX hydrolase [Dissulfurispiraceae bacterium]
MKPATIKTLKSAGGVVFRSGSGGPEVALIATKHHTVWTLPKGLIDPGEVAEQAAVREIREETGLIGAIVAPLGEKSFWFYLKNENIRCKKNVSYFLVAYAGGSVDDFGPEVDEARWFPIDAALETVSYKSDIELLRKARELLHAYTENP